MKTVRELLIEKHTQDNESRCGFDSKNSDFIVCGCKCSDCCGAKYKKAIEILKAYKEPENEFKEINDKLSKDFTEIAKEERRCQAMSIAESEKCYITF